MNHDLALSGQRPDNQDQAGTKAIIMPWSVDNESDRTKNGNIMSNRQPTFVDAFAGCGGLSLGLFRAGWRGLFAIERDEYAYETLRRNLVVPSARYRFSWPRGLPKKNFDIQDLLIQYQERLTSLSGKVDLLVGGPPCQGFSTAGRRNPSDPRNQLTHSYLELVELLQPSMVLIENVRGMTSTFRKSANDKQSINYAKLLVDALTDRGYRVSNSMIDTSEWGVPQKRHRLIIVGLKIGASVDSTTCPIEAVRRDRPSFLSNRKIHSLPISSRRAISDLEVTRNGFEPSNECPGFQQIKYKGPRTSYQKLLNDDTGADITDTRLARHSEKIQARFKKIIEICHNDGRLNTSLSKELRESLGLQKCAIRVMDPDEPAPTITSMPDDLIHYSEPRCLTVRENARLQSFPDWYQFYGKYTTGGLRRRSEVPRFTQVANAVPPLLAEAIGVVLIKYFYTATNRRVA